MNSGSNPHQTGRGLEPHAHDHSATPAPSSKSNGKLKQLQIVVSNYDRDKDDDDEDDGLDDEDPNDTVGSLLADIAVAINDALRMLMFADKRHWSPDEFEQVRALEDALDEAKKDFQEMGPLLKGSQYYENDRRPESLSELRMLRGQFAHHAEIFKNWLRQGGPINPVWASDTLDLRRQLHRAQRRAAARIYASQQADIAGTHRCLGAFEVYRRQRRLDERRRRYEKRLSSRYESTRDELAQAEEGQGKGGRPPTLRQKGRVPSWQQQPPTMGDALEAMEMGDMGSAGDGNEAQTRYGQPPDAAAHQQQQQQRAEEEAAAARAVQSVSLEELVPACNAVGHFERFGDRDVAFSCDFCDGFLVWEDLAALPAERDPLPAATGVTEQPQWQARGKSVSSGGAEDRTVIFAPLAIANHLPPDPGDWRARLSCPYCDEYDYYEAGGEDEARYVQDERGFGSLREFQEHLEWYHTSVAVPSLPTAVKNCVVM